MVRYCGTATTDLHLLYVPCSTLAGVVLQPRSSTMITAFKYSVKTMHPFFMDKLYSGSDPTGQVAELVTTVLNTAVHVYHVAPVFSIMEVEVLKIYA